MIQQIDFLDEHMNPQCYRITHPALEKIEEHCSRGEGDKGFYDVSFKDGRVERIFNPSRVIMK